ncbi:MAG: EAL domain-containing protein [Spirochaetota bacterium]
MKKILVIEDQESVRENITSILQFEGYDYRSAANGKEGLSLAETYVPDLILCDIMMPNMNGYEVFQALHNIQTLANIPFIFITAKTTIEEIRYGMTIGADDYITKPFSASDLISAIRTRLQKHEKISKKLHQTEKKLLRASHYDLTTDLPNQIILKKELDQRILQNIADKEFFVTFFRVDNFEHSAIIVNSDERVFLLQQVISNLQKVLQDDLAKLFHIETNEFALVLTEKSNLTAEMVAEIILKTVRTPVKVKSYEFNLTASIGIAFHNSLEDSMTLIQNTRMTVESVFESGGNQFRIFNVELQESIKNQILIENKLHRSVENKEFKLHYQAKVDIQTGHMIGMEALIRWKSPELGFLPPSSFMKYVENSRLIFSIGEWVLRQACLQNKFWQDQGHRKMRVSVNVSPIQILESDFPLLVEKILEETALEPRWLELELTEMSLLEKPERCIETMHRLQKLGILLAIDDFGTGYSSFAYITELPINIIKIDKKFVHNIVESSHDRMILQTIIQLAFTLGMDVVAEGLENAEQLEVLAVYGLRYIQGYYFSKPVDKDTFTRYLQEDKKLVFPL